MEGQPGQGQLNHEPRPARHKYKNSYEQRELGISYSIGIATGTERARACQHFYQTSSWSHWSMHWPATCVEMRCRSKAGRDKHHAHCSIDRARITKEYKRWQAEGTRAQKPEQRSFWFSFGFLWFSLVFFWFSAVQNPKKTLRKH